MNYEKFESLICGMEKKSYSICERLLSKDIVLLPAGRFYRLSIRALRVWDIPIKVLADKNPEISRGRNVWKFDGREYVAENTEYVIKRHGNNVNYILSSRPFRKDIEKHLLESGINKENIFYMPVRMGDLVPTSSFRRKFEINKSFDDILRASSMLEDEASRQQLWELLSIFACNTPVWIEKLPSKEYFNTPYLSIGSKETFFDAGMYDGNTIREFIEMCPDYEAIYGVEANPSNMQLIRNNLEQYSNIHLFNNALCNCESSLKFKSGCEGWEGARLDEAGDIFVEGLRGDSLDIKPTFMKFDIEGAEYDALKGFERTIHKFKPKMAISVYHSLVDHWRLILLIKKLCPDYKLYLCHHYGYEDLYGTIMYARM